MTGRRYTHTMPSPRLTGGDDRPRPACEKYPEGERWAHVVLGRPLKDDPPKRRAKATARHGTDAGYFRHLRKTKDEPCDDCRAAHAEAQGRYNRRRNRSAA